MSKLAILLCVAFSCISVLGCQSESVDGIESINVADYLTSQESYNIDLTRVDAVYYVAPNLDTTHLSVICPTGIRLSFADYVTLRIEPTGASYEPSTTNLFLANGSVPQSSIDRIVQTIVPPTLRKTGVDEPAALKCEDIGMYEFC